jgi:PAS domain S-box-containing protein
MKISHKLFLGSFMLALLIGAVGLYAVTVSRRALRESIERTSANLAAKVMDEVDGVICAAIDDWRIYASSVILRRALDASNEQFEGLPDVRAYIDLQDRQWQAASKEALTPFMQALLDNELSVDLRGKLQALERVHGHAVFGEVFVTNRHGATVGLSGRTSDYRQDDEEWWELARKLGTYVSDVQYDESAGIHSVDICLRMDDEDGGFLGVLKAVFDIQGVIRVLEARASIARPGGSGSTYGCLRLHTADKKVIFSSRRPFTGLRDGAKFFESVQPAGEGPVQSFLRRDEELGELLAACAFSQGSGHYRGLGWILVLEHRAEDVFARANHLRNAILIISGGVAVMGLLVGMLISTSISRRLTRLRNAAVEIGRGNLEVRTKDRSADEIGQLSVYFNNMARDLQETTVSRSYMENILRSMVDTLIIISPEGVIQRANAAACALLGYDEHELLDRPIAQVLADRDPFEGAGMEVLLEEGAIPSFDTLYLTKDGRKIPVSFSASVMRDEEERFQGIVCVAIDITKRKQAEAELARSNEELEQFAYVASHDLQEPLRMVSSYVQLLARRYQGRLDTDADEFIDFAVDGAKRMQTLITDLLKYSRVRTRGHQFEPTDSGAVLDGVLADLGETIRETSATVTHDALPQVMADPTQLGQLFQNLVGNAIKYHGHEPPRVRVSAEPDGSMWQFAVRDNGIGIEPEYQERIFAIFQRLHGREEYPGTGIGLAVCKGIVERHGGRIWVESEPGKGSTFHFTLPKQGAIQL